MRTFSPFEMYTFLSDLLYDILQTTSLSDASFITHFTQVPPVIKFDIHTTADVCAPYLELDARINDYNRWEIKQYLVGPNFTKLETGDKIIIDQTLHVSHVKRSGDMPAVDRGFMMSLADKFEQVIAAKTYCSKARWINLRDDEKKEDS